MLIIEKTPTQLISHNVVDETYPQYSALTEYAVGTYVLFNNNIYKNKEVCTGKQPDINPLFWEDNGAINSLKWDDKFINSQTAKIGSEDLIIILKPYVFNSVSFFNLDAESVEIVIGEYVQTINLVSIQISNWTDYFFNDIDFKKDVFVQLPIFFNVEVTIKIKATSDKAVGVIFFGKTQDSGCTELAPSVGYDDYSTFNRNESGLISIKEGRYSKRASLKVTIPINAADSILKKMYRLRNKMNVFVGNGYEGMLLLGFPRNFEETYVNDVSGEYNLEIEGV